MPYLLDADVLIDAKNRYYAFDFCPAFWDWVIDRNAAGLVFSIEKVSDELKGRADELTEWAALRGDRFFLRPGPSTLPALATVSNWATAQSYEPAAISEFFNAADYYLVAQALSLGYTVVTREVPSPSTKKIKISNPCIGLGVKVMNPYEMLRVERARFLLGPVPPSAAQLPLVTT